MRDDIALFVANGYLQVLLNKANLDVIEIQNAVTLEQIDRVNELVDAGVLPKGDLLEIKAVRVEAVIKGKKKSFDFLVKRNGIDDTLEKIMGWSLQEEEYEMCQRVKNLQEKLDKENQF